MSSFQDLNRKLTTGLTGAAAAVKKRTAQAQEDGFTEEFRELVRMANSGGSGIAAAQPQQEEFTEEFRELVRQANSGGGAAAKAPAGTQVRTVGTAGGQEEEEVDENGFTASFRELVRQANAGTNTAKATLTGDQLNSWFSGAGTAAMNGYNYITQTGWRAEPDSAVAQEIDSYISQAEDVRQTLMANRGNIANYDELMEGYAQAVEALRQAKEGVASTDQFHSQFKREAEYDSWAQEQSIRNMDLDQRLEWYAQAQEQLQTLTGAEKEALQDRIARYERGEGEFATTNADGYQTDFHNAVTDKYAALLREDGFLDEAQKAVDTTYIPSMEDLNYMDQLINDQNMEVDVDANGQVFAKSSIDGSYLVKDEDGNFHHAMEYDARYTQIDRLGTYLSASAQDKEEGLHGAISTWQSIYDEGIANHWDFLTADEVSVYYGLKAQSVNEANAYLEEMQSTLNHRYENARTLEMVAEYESAGWLQRMGMQGWGIVQSTSSGLGAAVAMAGDAIRGEETDVYGAAFSGTRYANAVRTTQARRIDEWSGGANIAGYSLGDVYQALMSGADSLAVSWIPGGSAILGTTAAANKAMELYQQGASQEQVLGGALAAGVIETAAEAIPLEKLNFLKTKDVNTWADWGLNTLKQAGCEFGEEAATEIANGIADVVSRRSQSDWAKLWTESGGNGWSVAGTILGEVLTAGVAGAVAGAATAGVVTAKNTAKGTAQTRSIGATVKQAKGGLESLKAYTQSVAEAGGDKKLSRFANSLSDKSSNARVGKAYRLTEAAASEQSRADISKSLQRKGYSAKTAETIAEVMLAKVKGYQLTEQQESAWEQVSGDPDVQRTMQNVARNQRSTMGQRNQQSEDFRQEIQMGLRAAAMDAQARQAKDGAEDPSGAALPQDDAGAAEDRGAEIATASERAGLAMTEAPDDGGEGLDAPGNMEEDIASPQIRQQMRQAYAAGEISEAEYDAYLDAVAEQQGLDGVTEETQLQKELEERSDQEPVSFEGELMRQWAEPYTAGTADVQAGENVGGNWNGGNENGTGVLHGSSQRYDGAGAGEQAGSLAGRAGTATQRNRSAVDRIRKTNQRRALGTNLRLERVSSQSLGVKSGTERANLRVIPEEHWDDGLRAKAEQVWQETGKSVTYVLGAIEVKGTRGQAVRTRGIITESGIIVQADNSKLSAEQIADHEAYHGMADFWREMSLNQRLIEKIKQIFSKEEFDKVLDKYIFSLRETIDVEGAETGEERAKRVKKVEEELLADAYAGINAFGNGATKFTDTVRDYLRDNRISREDTQANGTEQPTGPPIDERYSVDDESSSVKQQIIENQDILNAMNPVATINVPNEFLQMDKAGKQNWVINKLRPTGYQVNRRGFGIIEFAKKRLKSAYNYFRKGSAEEAVFEALPQVLEKGVEISEHANHKGRAYETVTIAAPVVVNGRPGNMAVVVKRTTANFYKVHRIFSPDGSAFQLSEMTKEAEPTPGGGVTYEGSLATPISSASKNNLSQRIAEVKQQIQAVLDKVSDNHAWQMQRYTELKDSDPEAAQSFYDDLMNGLYSMQFEEYLELTEKLERLEDPSTSLHSAQDDGVEDGFVERASVDDPAAEDMEELSGAAASQADGGSTAEQAKAQLVESLRKLTPQQMMGDKVRQLIDQYTSLQPQKQQAQKYKVDRGNLKRALTSTLGLSKEQRAELGRVLDSYEASMKPKGKKWSAQQQDVEFKASKAKQKLRKKIFETFYIQAGSRDKAAKYIDYFADMLVKKGSLTDADRRSFFAQMYESGTVTVAAEQSFSAAREYLRKGRIYVNDSVRAEFGDDWNDFRKRAFGNGIYLTKDKADAGVDVWQQRMYQDVGLIDPKETSMREVLEQIVQIAEEGRDEQVSLAEYVAMVAEEEYTSEDEVLDQLERQMEWALKSFAESAQIEIDLKTRSWQEKVREREENQKKAQLRYEADQLKALQKDTLAQLAWLKKKRKKSPDEIKAKIDAVLGDIDVYAMGAANALNWNDRYGATWADLAAMIRKAEADYEGQWFISDELKFIRDRVDGVKIEDIVNGEDGISKLMDLFHAAIGLRHEIENRRYLLKDGARREFAAVQEEVRGEIAASTTEFEWSDGKNAVKKFLNEWQLTPLNYIQRLAGWNPDSTFLEMAKGFEEGARQARRYKLEAKKMLEGFIKKNRSWLEKADGQGSDGMWYSYKVKPLLDWRPGEIAYGPEVTIHMAPLQKVHLYLASQCEDNLRHIKCGGVMFANKELYSRGSKRRKDAFTRQKDPIRLTPAQVQSLVADMTAEELELAEILKRYYNEYGKGKINEISLAVNGFEKAMNSNYVPIHTAKAYFEHLTGPTREGKAENRPKARVEDATAPLVMLSAIEEWEQHVDKYSLYYGMTIPTRNWDGFLNWSTAKKDRAGKSRLWKDIEHKWGGEAETYLRDFSQEMQGQLKGESQDFFSRFLGELHSRYIGSTFASNPKIVAKQGGSFWMAAPYLGWKNIPVFKKGGIFGRADKDLIFKYTPDLEWRLLGYSSPEAKEVTDNPKGVNKLLTKNKVTKFLFAGGSITAMDAATAGKLWAWSEKKVRREFPDLEVGTQAQIDAGESPFYQKVAELFNDTVARTQSTSEDIYQSKIRKSKHPLTKVFTMFKSDSAQSYNAIRQKYGEAQYYKRMGDKKNARKARIELGHAVLSTVLNNLWAEAINIAAAGFLFGWKGYRDDEDELTLESVAAKALENMLTGISGVVMFGEEAAGLIGNWLTGDKWYALETAGLEQLNNLIESGNAVVTEGKDFFEGLSEVIEDGGDGWLYAKNHANKLFTAGGELAELIGTFCNVPVSNLKRYILEPIGNCVPGLKQEMEDILGTASKQSAAGLTGTALETKIGNIFEGHGVDASESSLEMLAALYENGYTDAVPGDTPSTVTVAGEKHTMSEYQKQTYEAVWGSIVGDALDSMVELELFTDADEETQAKMLKSLYSYAAARAKAELFDEYELTGSDAKTAAAVEAGLDLADYLARKSALDDATDAERWRAAVDSQDSVADQLAALSAEMTPVQYRRATVANDYGVEPEVYVRVQELLPGYDADGNGSYKQAEVTAAIDGISRKLGLSTKQKAALWQLATGSSSAKNNPYNASVGQAVIDALEKLKEEDDKSLSFGELVIKQMMGDL